MYDFCSDRSIPSQIFQINDVLLHTLRSGISVKNLQAMFCDGEGHEAFSLEYASLCESHMAQCPKKRLVKADTYVFGSMRS